MSSTAPDFEIDHPEEFGAFILDSADEIIFYLNLLARRRCQFTAYLDQGSEFFSTAIAAVDRESGRIFLDRPPEHELILAAGRARQVTLVTKLDRVKMQFRLTALRASSFRGQETLAAPLPETMLRLQRREFFRLEPPPFPPLVCRLGTGNGEEAPRNIELPVADISGGGLSLVAAPHDAGHFPRDTLFQRCRLEIPDEGVVQVGLRVRKVMEVALQSGEHILKVGCEFVSLPGITLAFIERYIARVERERKAKGLDQAG